MYFLTQLLIGLKIGSVYAMVALGYTMVYGIVKLINFAHGDIIMVGGYMVFSLLASGQPLWVAMLGAILFCALVGVLIQRVAYQRLLNKKVPRITLLITAIGISLFLQNLYQLIYGAGEKGVSNIFDLPKIYVGSLVVTDIILNVSVSLLMVVLLQLLVNKTKVGKAMRATSEDPAAAVLMGVDTGRIIMFTFAVGSGLAAVGAVLNMNSYPAISPTMGGTLGIKAFVAAVLGGIGSIPGAMLGGYLIGVAESMATVVDASAYSDAVVFGILIIVLLVKPAGLLGKHVKEKV